MKDLILFNDEGICISTEKSRLDLDMLHDFLSTKAYWSLHLPRAVMERSIAHSLCFGVYDGARQIGFARVVSDLATVAYLGDVFIVEAYRNRGLGKWLIATVMNHPDLAGLRRWMLLTRDAHALYRQAGWKEIADPSRWMEKHHKNPYPPAS